MDAEFQYQAFETDLLGVPVGKLFVTDGAVPDALAGGWRNDGVWLVTARVAETSDIIPSLEELGFRAVETLVTLRHDLSGADAAPGVRLAEVNEFEDCLGVANRAFVNDRLHRDPLVPDWVADKIRSQWVLNNLESRGDASFVVSDDDGVAGFNLCLMEGGDAVIDLIAVDTGRQKKGFGRALVNGALGHYRGKAETMRVGTQADNEPSIALYRGTGFVEIKRQVTLHWINPDEESAPKPEEDAP